MHRSLLILCLCLSATAVRAAPGPNLLVNGGAETGDLTGWSIRSTIEGTYPSPRLAIDSESYVPSPPNHSGNHRFSVEHAYEFVCFFQYQVVAVEPGREYEAGFSCTQMDGTDQFLSLYVYEGDVLPGFRPEDTPLQGMETQAAYGYLCGAPHGEMIPAWTTFPGRAFRPSTNRVTLALYYRHIWETGPSYWNVDDIYLRAVEANPAPTPTPGGGPPGNLLINPGGENGDMSGWSWGGDTFPTFDFQLNLPWPINHSGDHRFSWSSSYENNRKGFLYQVVDTVPGNYHEIGLYLYQHDGTDAYLDVFTADGGVNHPWEHRSGAGIGPYRNWTWHSTLFRPTGPRTAVIVNFKHIWASGMATFHVDDLYVVDHGPSPPSPSPTPSATSTPTRTATPSVTPTRVAGGVLLR